jgi:hypothetical protein
VLISLLLSRCRCVVAVLVLKSILGRGPKVKESLKTPSSRSLGWEAFILGYVVRGQDMIAA